ncbi:MAG: hypothetical protein MUW56_20820 [Chryseobacterium sp.]|uniref:hypothetical protein n=1 Tax=Chryseobacterium sp. TaxID=1871047 RepID=UPI0025BCD9E8|nr:hypothetical protein [Chryseobacterium sp.]MCJ7936000.1 hypothetical protein [Chryseobacterium sp.]
MKAIFVTVFFACLISCKNDQNKTDSQSGPGAGIATVKKGTKPPENGPDIIENIRKEYNILHGQMEAKQFKTSDFTYDCNNEISGKAIYYSEQGDIRVIEHSYAEHDHFSGIVQYFIKNGKVFFIYREETVWNFDGGTPEKPVTKDDTTETRIYVENDQPVQCLEKMYSIRSNTAAKPSPDNIPGKEVSCNIGELMKAYQSLINSKDQKGEVRKCL